MGERGSPEVFLGSVILAKRDFFGSMKYTHIRVFWGHEKTQGFFWYFTLHSTQMNSNISTIYCWCGIFWVC